jgi:ABC-type branched-subunit amino acid transport system ATPase component
MALLEVRDLVAGYRGLPIVHGVDLDLEAGELVAVVGPNGAGKSTLIKALFGLSEVMRGEVRLAGRSIAGERASRIVARGMAYVPQVQNIFPSLTVRENLEMGGYLAPHQIEERLAAVVAMFPDLGAAMRRRAGELSGGQRNMLALARALMTEPKVMLLDEPTAGLSPMFADRVWEHVRRVAAHGVAVLVVEQNARRALLTAQRGYVMVNGRVAFSGDGAALVDNPDVVASYLGRGLAS